MKNLIVSFMIVVAFALTAFAQEQIQEKKKSQVRTGENKELKAQTQEKKQSQNKVQENKELKQQTQEKVQTQVRMEEHKELKEQTQEKKQSQVQVKDKQASKEQTKEMKQVKEQKQLQQYSDMDGDGVNDYNSAKMAKDSKSGPKSDVGHGEGAGEMQRPRDRNQDGKMAPGSGEGPQGDTPRSQKGSRKGQKI